jgi:hypothetical protein
VGAAKAYAYAVSLQRWQPTYRGDLASTLSALGDVRRMREQYRRALRWNPANAYLWLNYAQGLARANHLDPEFELALVRAARLAPQLRPLQWHSAWLGVGYWNQGGEQARQTWALNFSDALRLAPEDFLKQILLARREHLFCGYAGAELGLGRWCGLMIFLRGLCDGMPADSRIPAAGNCQRLGLLPPAKAGERAR